MRLIDADMLMEDLGSDIPEDIVKVIENSPHYIPYIFWKTVRKDGYEVLSRNVPNS